jgi:hypothetical protein
MNGRPSKTFSLLYAAALGLAALSGAGCQLYHNLGTGEHYDAPEDRPASDKAKRVRDIVVEVTTDAAGAVTVVHFKRSSGSPVIDQTIANSLQAQSGKPSTLTVVELTYSGEKGFSQPKVVRTSPAPAAAPAPTP